MSYLQRGWHTCRTERVGFATRWVESVGRAVNKGGNAGGADGGGGAKEGGVGIITECEGLMVVEQGRGYCGPLMLALAPTDMDWANGIIIVVASAVVFP